MTTAPTSRPVVLAALSLFASACGEGLPDVPLKLSKNCNEAEVVSLVPRVGEGLDVEVVDVAADGTLGETAWVLLRRPSAAGDRELVVQRVAAGGVEHETVLPFAGTSSPLLSPAPESGRVWVVLDEPGRYEVWRVAPDDPSRPLVGSADLSSFPTAGPPCTGCELDDWPRRLFFLPTGPALVTLPRESFDAGLTVWVGALDTSTAQIRLAAEHQLNFEPPCDDSTPEGEAFCEEQHMNLRYPEIALLAVQQDPRQTDTVLFGHRTRSQSYDGQEFPLRSADVFMVTLHLDGDGIPAGNLRSYAGIYIDPTDTNEAPVPTAVPPYGVAVDRFAAFGLFNNDGTIPRMIELPEADPEFTELTERIPQLTLDTSLLQLDRDVALGRLEDGAWRITKLFPDDPSQSRELVYEDDAPIEEVVSGGVGTFMLRKQDAPPELVRLRCLETPDDDP